MANKSKKQWRKYTAAERAARLAVLKANGGNLARTARETGVPRNTLRTWAAAAGLDLKVLAKEVRPVCGTARLTELGTPHTASTASTPASTPKKSVGVEAGAFLQDATVELTDRLEALAVKLVGIADQKADGLNAKDAMIAAGVAIDKRQVLLGKGTSISDVRRMSDEELEQRKTELTAEIARMRARLAPLGKGAGAAGAGSSTTVETAPEDGIPSP
jgi:ribosomal protein L29